MCPDGIPNQDGVPLEWAAPWENRAHTMVVEEEEADARAPRGYIEAAVTYSPRGTS